MATPTQVPAGRAILVGLGNPGAKYEGTRHNIGFMVVRRLAERWNISLDERRFKAITGSGQIAGRPVLLVLPQTFMNLSGESVSAAARFYKCNVASIVVAHDELDLSLGRLRLKCGGGNAGHNGLRSMDALLPSKDYFRVRLGIDRPPGGNVTSWVLGRFARSEHDPLLEVIEDGADAFELLLRQGLTAAQAVHHAPSKATL